MSLFIGGSEPSAIHWGGEAYEVYLGPHLVWRSGGEPLFERHLFYAPDIAGSTLLVPEWAGYMFAGGIAAGGGGSFGAGIRDGRGGGAGRSASTTIELPGNAISVTVQLGAPGAGGASYGSGGPDGKSAQQSTVTLSLSNSTAQVLQLYGGVGRGYNSSGSSTGDAAAPLALPDGFVIPGGSGGTMTNPGQPYGGGGGGGRRTGDNHGRPGGPAALAVCFWNQAWDDEHR